MDVEDLYQLFRQFRADQTEETARLRQELHDTKAQVTGLRLELTESKEEIEGLKKAQVRGGPSTGTGTSPNTQCRCESFSRQITALTKKIKEIEGQNKDLREKWQNLTKLQHVLNSFILRCQRPHQFDEQVQRLQTQLQSLRHDVAVLKDSDTRLERHILKMTSKADPLDSLFQLAHKSDAEIKSIRRDMAALETRLTNSSQVQRCETQLQSLRQDVGALATSATQTTKDMEKKFSKIAGKPDTLHLLFKWCQCRLEKRNVELPGNNLAGLAFLEGRAGLRNGPAWNIIKTNMANYEDQVKEKRAVCDYYTAVDAKCDYIMMITRFVSTTTFFLFAAGQNSVVEVVSVNFETIKAFGLFDDKVSWEFKVEEIKDSKLEPPTKLTLIFYKRKNFTIVSPESQEIQDKLQIFIKGRK